MMTITILSLVIVLVGATTVPPPVEAQQQQQPSIATDGGLSASVAKDNYNAGDFVIINGTVAKYTHPSVVIIQVIDPKGRQVEYEESRISVRDNKTNFALRFKLV